VNDEDPPRGTDKDEDGPPSGKRQSSRRTKAHSRSRAAEPDVTLADTGAEVNAANGERESAGSGAGAVDPADSGAPSDGVFIAGVEAAVAAGMTEDDDDNGYRRFEPEPPATSYSAPEDLLDWTEPPTGQVPRVLLGDEPSRAGAPGPGVRGPVWREQGTDWDDETDLSHLTGEGEAVIPASGGSIDDEDPFEFEFEYGGRLGADDERRRATALGSDAAETRSGLEDTNPNPVVYGPSVPGEGAESDPAISWQSWAGDAAGGSVLGDPIGTAGVPEEGTVEARPAGRRHAQRKSAARSDTSTEELAPASRMRRRGRAATIAGAGAAAAGAAAAGTAGAVGAAGGEGLGAAGAAGASGVAGAAAASTTAATATATAPSSTTGIPAVTSRPLATTTGPTTGVETARTGDDIRTGRSGPGPGRNVGVAILTGLGIGVVAVICFLLGSVATLALATITVAAAGAECFAGMRRAGYRPATLVGLIGIPTLLICAYLKGPEAMTVALAVFTMVTLLWYLAGVSREDPVSNIGATLAAFMWVGMLGSFAGLLLAPSLFPRGNGVALLVGAIVPTVGYDVAAFAAGAWFGTRKLAPSISPGKTWEGLIAGAAAAIILSVAVISQIKPWTISSALVAGIIVAVLAPIGDLCESMFKRSLGLKDMGSLLPAHGGVLDRVDGLLFVLPAIYIFVRVAHIT
jgi:CDP-diglyceride synthetase